VGRYSWKHLGIPGRRILKWDLEVWNVKMVITLTWLRLCSLLVVSVII